MAGFTQAEQVATLDARFPVTGGSDYVAYSENGTTESSAIARTAIGATGWAGATNATPSVKANANVLTSAAATGAATIGYFGVFSASTAGTQRTDWTALAVAKTVAVGDTLQAAIGAIKITLD